MRIRAVGLALWGALALASAAHAESFTQIAVDLGSANGEGSFDDTIACTSGGDGPSWRYGYSGIVSPGTSPLAGTWKGTVDVHQAANPSTAFIPSQSGRLRIEPFRGGAALLEFGSGTCGSAGLALTRFGFSEASATGSVPVVAAGGVGAMRGFSGSGVLSIDQFELGAGADNVADLGLGGTFTVRQPTLSLGEPVAYWANFAHYMMQTLTVVVPVTNPWTPEQSGDAFDVSVDEAQLDGVPTKTAMPMTLGRINARGARDATLLFEKVSPLTSSGALTLDITRYDALGHARKLRGLKETVHIPDSF